VSQRQAEEPPFPSPPKLTQAPPRAILATMHPSLEKLVRILELERRQGYTDRAVIGGLAAFLPNWQAGARGQLADDGIDAIGKRLAGYAQCDPDARKARVAAAMSVAEAMDRPARPIAAEKGEIQSAATRGKSESPAPAPPRKRRPATAAATAHPPAPGAPPAPPDLAASLAPPHAEDDPALDQPVTQLRGIGAKAAENLRDLGIVTVRDLLLHAPSRYKDWSQLQRINQLRPGEETTIIGTVWDVKTKRLPNGRNMLTVVLSDTTATIGCTFFNQPFLEREFQQGNQIVVSGKVEAWAGRLTFRAPEWEHLDRDLVHTGRLVPIYPLTQRVTQRSLRKQIRQAVDTWAERFGDPLPAEIRAQTGLMTLPAAVRALHVPATQAEADAAWRRLAFDELLVLQLYLRQRRARARGRPGISLAEGSGMLPRLTGSLPFALTGAQERVIGEIAADLAKPEPMSRLLQGDVGCGKTAVAAAAVVMCVGAGYQAALMAPTEILADQHAAGLGRMLEPLGFRAFDPALSLDDQVVAEGYCLARLTGSQKPREKAATAAAIRAGAIDLVIGTHAVIQESVQFDRLGLAVVDEQHRFGVLQRAELKVKGEDEASRVPHLLIMTATPIPRTLAQALNADLDQSVIDELPPGRQPIKTVWLQPVERERAYEFIRHRVSQGQQAYIVCPLVEDSEAIQSRAAVAEHERLSREVMPDLRVGLLHGRMRPAEKDAVMQDFYGGRIDVLVSTSVIEVGVDVPNATVMLIDGADRFGLAQLHQFRGRVGRGAVDSVCLLLADNPSQTAADRLALLTETSDGLKLAERDLEVRGPGDYFGLRQSGDVDRFRFARLAPGEALTLAARVASEIVAGDPDLARPELAGLGARVAAFSLGAERV
jgi:ATP-dependent DNA helicase RecG